MGFQKGYCKINKAFVGKSYPKNPNFASKTQYLHCLGSNEGYFELLKKYFLTKNFGLYGLLYAKAENGPKPVFLGPDPLRWPELP